MEAYQHRPAFSSRRHAGLWQFGIAGLLAALALTVPVMLGIAGARPSHWDALAPVWFGVAAVFWGCVLVAALWSAVSGGMPGRTADEYRRVWREARESTGPSVALRNVVAGSGLAVLSAVLLVVAAMVLKPDRTGRGPIAFIADLRRRALSASSRCSGLR